MISIIHASFIPQLRLCSSAGSAVVRTSEDIFLLHPMAVEMAVNILSERGFTVSVQARSMQVPVAVDLQTGAIRARDSKWFEFTVGFPPARK